MTARPRSTRARVALASLACAIGWAPTGWAQGPPGPVVAVGEVAELAAPGPAVEAPVSEAAAPGDAAADDNPSATVMTDEQRRLYARGEAAAGVGDWPAAARYFRAAVSLGGFNLGFLGLGEALARQGRCAEAATALDAVPSSPTVPEAPARFADAMANAQRQALGRTCPGKLVVDCAAPMSRYRIIGGGEHDCGAPVELPAGRYRLRAGPDAMAVTVDAWVVGVETTRVTLQLPRPLPAEAILGPAPAPARSGSSGWSTAGAVVLGIGGAALLAGGGLHAVTLDAYLDAEDAADAVPTEPLRLEDQPGATDRHAEAEAAYARHAGWRQATVGVYVVGGVLALAGLAIIWFDTGGEAGPSPGSSLSAGPGWVGGRF